MITTQCMSCRHRYTISDDLLGRFSYCPQCGSSLTILHSTNAGAAPLTSLTAPIDDDFSCLDDDEFPSNPRSASDVDRSSHWYVRRGTGEHGPHAFEKLQLAVVRGYLDPGDLIRREQEDRWIKAESIAGLFDGDEDVILDSTEEQIAEAG